MPIAPGAIECDVPFLAISGDGHSIGFPRAAPIAAESGLAEDEAEEEDGEDGEGDVDVEPVALAGKANH